MRSRIDNGQENLFVRILPTPHPSPLPYRTTSHRTNEPRLIILQTRLGLRHVLRPASPLIPQLHCQQAFYTRTRANLRQLPSHTDTEFTAVTSACRDLFNQPTDIIYSLKYPSRNTIQNQLFKLKWSFVQFKLTFST